MCCTSKLFSSWNCPTLTILINAFVDFKLLVPPRVLYHHKLSFEFFTSISKAS